MGNDWETTFGHRLREEREIRGWSQGKLAEEMAKYGVTLHTSAIAKMEARDAANPRSIRLNEAAVAAQALHLSLLDLLTPVTSPEQVIEMLLQTALASASQAESSAQQALELLDDADGLTAKESADLRKDLMRAINPKVQNMFLPALHRILEVLDRTDEGRAGPRFNANPRYSRWQGE